jgi:hypothetical protein
MFDFTIELPKNWNKKAILPDTHVEGVVLNSPLGILISCLQGEFAQSLTISKSNFFEALDVRKFFGQSKESRELLYEGIREDFFGRDNEARNDGTKFIGKDELSKNEFPIFCDFLKKTTNLRTLQLHVENLPFTEEEEQGLIEVLKENLCIQSVIMVGGTKEMASAIKAARPSLELTESGLVSRDIWRFRGDETYRAQVLQQIKDERNSMNSQAACANFNMHLLQGFITVLGAIAVATAFLLLSTAALNPAGIALAASGTAALALGVHSFFTSQSREPEKYTPTELKFIVN